MAPKYRKKPVVIEAIQVDGGSDNLLAIAEWMAQAWFDSGPEGEIYIETLEGTMRADVGDFIIKGVQGEFYPCKPDIFDETYVAVFDADPGPLGTDPLA